jgi:hypothetical protein
MSGAAAPTGLFMPPRGHSTAPSFDPTAPRELRRYFSDLELLFTNCSIVNDKVKKQHAVRYLPVDTSDLWEEIPEFAPGTSYADYKTTIFNLYPGAGEERKWLYSDMKSPVTKQAKKGINDLQELSEYYRQFFTITQYLKNKAQISDTEQRRTFVEGFQPSLWNRIKNRLDIKFPDHNLDIPFTLTEVNDAAKYVLHDATPGDSVESSTSESSSPSIKTEALSTFLDQFARTLVQALRPGQLSSSTSTMPRNDSTNIRPSHSNCNFCGIPGHFLNSCQVVEQYIREGKCRRSPEGRIILPGGGSIPRNISGDWIKDRIDEYHKRNTGQIVIGQLSSNTNASLMYNIVPQSSQTPGIIHTAPSTNPSVFHLDVDECIAALKCEIMTLRNHKTFDGVEMPKQMRGPDNHPQQPRTELNRIPPMNVPAPPTQPQPTNQNNAVTSNPADPKKAPIHPFAKAREPNYLPPHERNLAGPPPKQTKDREYQIQAPIEDPQVASNIYLRWLKTPNVTLTLEELLSLSPDVRNKVREAITTK